MSHERISINPTIMFGKPVIAGTRIPVELIVRKLTDGATIAQLLVDHPHLAIADIGAALEFSDSSVGKKADLAVDPEPAWEVAHLFPAQGHWSEEEYLALNTNRLVEFDQGVIEVLPCRQPRIRRYWVIC